MPDALLAKKRSEIMRGNRLISLSDIDMIHIDGKYYVYGALIQKIVSYIKSKKHKDVFFYLNVDLDERKIVGPHSIYILGQYISSVHQSNLQNAIENFVCDQVSNHLFYASMYNYQYECTLVVITGIYQEYNNDNVTKTIIHYNRCVIKPVQKKSNI